MLKYGASTQFKDMVIHHAFTIEDSYRSFAFNTVFYRTPYSYCCCPCAYEHETFDYLSDRDDQTKETHVADKDVFRKIVKSIDDGRCPHVSQVEPKYVAFSCVFTPHILAVSGSRKMFEIYNIGWSGFSVTRIFHLHPFVNLVLKNSCNISILTTRERAWSFTNVGIEKLMYPTRSKDDHQNIHWERLSLFECCARKTNRNEFQHFLMSLKQEYWDRENMSVLYDIALKYELRELLEDLIVPVNGFKRALVYLHSKRRQNNSIVSWTGAEAAIVYNQPTMLDRIISQLAGKSDGLFGRLLKRLFFICLVLDRAECREVLLKYVSPELKNFETEDQEHELFHILLNYSFCREEMLSIIERHKKLKMHPSGIVIPNDYQANLHQFFNNELYGYRLHSSPVEKLKSKVKYFADLLKKQSEYIQFMTLGKGIDLTGVPIDYLYDVFRELAELCLFSNLSNLNNLAEQTVYIYLKQYDQTDLKVERSHYNIEMIFRERHDDPGKMGSDYIMDAKEHFLFSEENFALNFILPLFIECGFPLKRDQIDNILQNEEVSTRLHPAETEYLIKSLECPRSLQLCCRDTLRRHFKNRQIHQYVSISNVPKKMGDFILLKTVLPTLKYTVFKS